MNVKIVDGLENQYLWSLQQGSARNAGVFMLKNQKNNLIRIINSYYNKTSYNIISASSLMVGRRALNLRGTLPQAESTKSCYEV